MEKIEISHRSIIFTIVFLASVGLVYYLRNLILFFFVCIIFATALSPIVSRLERFKIPRGLAILLLYVLFVGGFAAAIASSVPLLVKQTTALIEDLPGFLDKVGFYRLGIEPSDYSDQLAKLPGNFFKLVSSAFSNLIKLFAFLVLSYYLLMERRNLKHHLDFLFAENGKGVERLVLEMERRLGGWVRGQLVLMFIVGLMSFIGLTLLDLEFVLPLAIIAGFLEIVPNIGPTVSAIPAVIVGFASSPVIGLAVMALYILIQQIENNLIVPKVMQKAVGLHPLVTLVALMIGFQVGGIGGSLLAIPLLLFVRVLVEQVYLPRIRGRK